MYSCLWYPRPPPLQTHSTNAGVSSRQGLVQAPGRAQSRPSTCLLSKPPRTPPAPRARAPSSRPPPVAPGCEGDPSNPASPPQSIWQSSASLGQGLGVEGDGRAGPGRGAGRARQPPHFLPPSRASSRVHGGQGAGVPSSRPTAGAQDPSAAPFLPDSPGGLRQHPAPLRASVSLSGSGC